MKRSGFSLLEILIVVAVIGVFASITIVSGSRIMKGQDELAAVSIMKQSLATATTAASSRGKALELIYQSAKLDLQEVDSGKIVRTFDLPKQTSLNVSNGTFLTFSEAGRIDPASLTNLPNPFLMTVQGKKYQLTISLIGEVKAEAIP
ncbi:MAG: type II secretion system protein [Trueperaceae bacterium]|nr:type II secretion system protein [Trueperaceae bacterium]